MILIRTTIDSTNILENQIYIESESEFFNFNNIRQEALKSSYNSINNTSKIADETNSFISFIEKRLGGRATKVDGIIVTLLYEELEISKNTLVKTTFYNYFDEEIPKAILNLSTNYNSPIIFNNITNEIRKDNFTINIDSNKNITLWIYYETPNGNVIENITIPIKVNKDSKFLSYFDLRIITDNTEIRDKFSEIIQIN